MPITIQHAKSDTVADFTGTVTIFNASGNSITKAATDLVRPSDWNSSHLVSIDVEGADLFTIPYWEPFFPGNTNSTLTVLLLGSWYLDQIYLPAAIGSGQLNLFASEAAGFINSAVYSAASTGANSRYQTVNTQLALYSQGTGAGSTTISSFWSVEAARMITWVRSVNATTTNALSVTNSLQASFPAQWDISGNVTYSTTSQSGSIAQGAASTMASSSADSLITGVVAYLTGARMQPMQFARTLAAGMYYLGMMISSTSSSTGSTYTAALAFSTASVLHQVEVSFRNWRRQGLTTTNSSSALPSWHGVVATVSSSPFATLGTVDIRNFTTGNRRVINYVSTSY